MKYFVFVVSYLYGWVVRPVDDWQSIILLYIGLILLAYLMENGIEMPNKKTAVETLRGKEVNEL